MDRILKYRLVSRLKGFEQESRILRALIKREGKKDRCNWPYIGAKKAIGIEARHYLLAYAFLKGVPYRSVEAKCREKNSPNTEMIVMVINTLYTYFNGLYNYFPHTPSTKEIQEWLEK